MAKTTSLKKEIQVLAVKMFELMGVDASVDISMTKDGTEGENVYQVNVEAEKEKGLLIGAHGSTLSAIQSFLSLAIRQRQGDWVRVVVNIGDWKQKQEEQLTLLANQAAQRALQTGQPQRLYNLDPSQRRIIHTMLSENQDVETQSQGEGSERYMVISPKS
ncbi:MAG: Single-stranded nucleic acid binding R3H domain protein [Candidatus Woesebacteria bacterium GW2011_GWB1_38_5b]|uniref:Single-stranded nucleic acid binding R3H domain protein n=1 Tax=Candidatus Woesebacteria bacterium GW2011_GWB1_38_5b TaxID=1618569 RepID=A0A0G0MML1_9BACT|nr:MAG: Single-stranded nucleic acid binding R3H domain protein [Candidatus Woesebacteria bacterium GW2011_GWB1_38_5b]